MIREGQSENRKVKGYVMRIDIVLADLAWDGLVRDQARIGINLVSSAMGFGKEEFALAERFIVDEFKDVM